MLLLPRRLNTMFRIATRQVYTNILFRITTRQVYTNILFRIATRQVYRHRFVRSHARYNRHLVSYRHTPGTFEKHKFPEVKFS